MSNYNDLIEFRNRLANDSKFMIYKEDCQLLDRILYDYKNFSQQLEEKNKKIEKLKEKYEERLTKTNDELIEIIQKLYKKK